MTASPTGTATLVAKGAAVNVDVTYSCSPGTTSASVFLQLTQRVSGGRVATGSGFVSGLVCDGTEHTTTVTLIADGDVAFKKGDAVVRGSRTACNEFGCVEGLLSPATVRIR